MTPRRIVITGGSSGLGLALAHELVKEGDELILIARNPTKLEAAAADIRTATPRAKVSCYPVDVSDAQAVLESINEIVALVGGIDLLINSAGILREAPFEETTEAVFRETFDINLFGLINCCRAALPSLRENHGAIVNIASMASLTGVFGYTAYCASKHAVQGFTESLYYELKPQGVRVQLICPPEFDSPMVDAIDDNRSPENVAQTLQIPKEPIAVIVDATLKAIRSGRYYTVTGFRARLVGLSLQYFPGIGRWMSNKIIAKAARP